ncbi:aminodeoxychorismate synthase component I [Saccharothrix texasensis]|uniref:aminodeoxychorismate synthase component I n=1 Tax=Saccharothrix texasensis TaxID=103734 RepID=UPI001FE5C914|nr:aminodeoxychorismate synthase component I [Saccharothrix texasensis]
MTSVLLIDNYDSFTYNIVHQLAIHPDISTTVLHNDDPALLDADVDLFDAIIISPGPGHPDDPRSFGHCTRLIDRADVPVLGVCLGHQGLAVRFGASVGRAANPRHGRTSPVVHQGDELFRNVPHRFEAVRYHSLEVTSLPKSVEAIAWADDGTIMALRHRLRPLWGVQFHPESILTRDGDTIVANFVEIANRWQRGPTRPVAVRPVGPTARGTRREPAVPADGTGLRVEVTTVDADLDPAELFRRVFASADTSFWLDSSDHRQQPGRFSYMGGSGGSRSRVAQASVADRTVTIRSADRGVEVRHESFFDWLDEELDLAYPVESPDLAGFALGWVGYLGYELKNDDRPGAGHRSTVPDAALLFSDRAIALDHQHRRAHVLTLMPAAGVDVDQAAWARTTAEVIASLHGVPAADVAARTPVVDGVSLRHAPESYLAKIRLAQEAIAAGDTYEVCLTNMITAKVGMAPLDAYLALRAANPTSYGAYLNVAGVELLSTSPERLLAVDAGGRMSSRPIKGTRPRADDPLHDTELRTALATSEKDRAENLMIVDLVRNDLGRVAVPGSVAVPRLFDVESYATVHQLVSEITSQKLPDAGPGRCVRAIYPGGSMTGAPKKWTMEIIDELEEGPRGIYSGSIGYFSLTGPVDLSIVIRTVVARDGVWEYGIGGAITTLSDPEEELAETIAKARPLTRLLGISAADLGIQEPGSEECVSDKAEIEGFIQKFLSDLNYEIGEDERTKPLGSSGIGVESLGVVELMEALGLKFGIALSDDEIVDGGLLSVVELAEFVHVRSGGPADGTSS